MDFFKNKLTEIQNSDADTKRKWLYGLSGATMIFVIIGWAIYVNSFILQPTDENQVETVEVGFWPVFKTGLSITAQNIGGKISDFVANAVSKIPEIGDTKVEINNPE